MAWDSSSKRSKAEIFKSEQSLSVSVTCSGRFYDNSNGFIIFLGLADLESDGITIESH